MSEKGEKVKEYKTIIAVIIIFIIIIILDIILDNNTIKNFNIINEKLNKIDEVLEEIDKTEEKSESESIADKEEAEKNANEIFRTWDKMSIGLSCYMEHNEIEKITAKINLIKNQIKIEDYGDSRQSIAETKYLIEHIKEKQQLNLENIF